VDWLPCCGGAPLPRRADFYVRSPKDCLMFSTGWSLIVRAESNLNSADFFIPIPALFPTKLLEFFFGANEFNRAIIEQNAAAMRIVVIESK